MAEHATSLSVGGYLRTLRQGKQASIEEMARATRVGSNQIEALEADRWADLPAPVFVKGFIRAYCHFLGERDEEALRRYREMLGERPLPERGGPAPRGHGHWSASPVFVSFVLLILFGGGLLTLNLVFKRGSKPAVPGPAPAVTSQPAPASPSPITGPAPAMTSQPAPASPSPITDPAPAVTSQPAPASPNPAPIMPAVTSQPAPASPNPAPIMPAVALPAAAQAESLPAQRLLVRAIEPTWIRIQTDDLRAVDQFLSPGDIREWTAEKRFLLTVGNAGGVEIELNGRPMPPLGQRGAVIRRLELPQAAAAGS